MKQIRHQQDETEELDRLKNKQLFLWKGERSSGDSRLKVADYCSDSKACPLNASVHNSGSHKKAEAKTTHHKRWFACSLAMVLMTHLSSLCTEITQLQPMHHLPCMLRGVTLPMCVPGLSVCLGVFHSLM